MLTRQENLSRDQDGTAKRAFAGDGRSVLQHSKRRRESVDGSSNRTSRAEDYPPGIIDLIHPS
jgi:hypothetical protein